MGLPGSTRQSFSNDLQQCADLDIKVRANRTTLLPNSPMNEPGYRQKYGIVAKPGEILMGGCQLHAGRLGRNGPFAQRLLSF